MKLSDAIKQLRKGYNLTNFQQAELLESLSNNGGEDPANSVSVLDLGVDSDPDIKWEDIQKVDAIRIGGEEESIVLLKSIDNGATLNFYCQVDDTTFIKLAFSNVDGKAKLYKSTFDNYRKISSVIKGVGDTETALSTLGANNLLQGKADLVNGLVPAAQLPSYVDDVVDFNGFTSNIVDVAEEDTLLNYPANTRWVCTATVEPFKSKYNQKILYVNANTSKEDWTIIEPEKDKIYINIGADGDAVNGDTFRWSGTAWVNLNQNLKERLTAVEEKLIVLNLGTIADVNDWYSKAPSSTLFISRSDIGVTLEESKDTLIKESSVIVILDPDGTKSPVPCSRTSTENDNYIWYGWLNASTVERLSYDASTRKFTIVNMQIGKDSLDSRIINLPYSQLGTTVSDENAQKIEGSSAIVLTTTGTNDPYNKVMFTRASTSATEIKFVNPTITGSSYSVEYITFNPETNSLSSINV